MSEELRAEFDRVRAGDLWRRSVELQREVLELREGNAKLLRALKSIGTGLLFDPAEFAQRLFEKYRDEGVAKDIQIEGLSNTLIKIQESHAELLAALKDCMGFSLFENPKWTTAVARAEKLK